MNGHVLVVEDDDAIRESLVEILQEHGFPATGAIHGRDGLDKLAGGLSPCLIVLDMMMPIMDGREFRAELDQIPSLARVPIVVISAHQDVAATAQEIGAAGYVSKPIKLSELLSIVGRHCRP